MPWNPGSTTWNWSILDVERIRDGECSSVNGSGVALKRFVFGSLVQVEPMAGIIRELCNPFTLLFLFGEN